MGQRIFHVAILEVDGGQIQVRLLISGAADHGRLKGVLGTGPILFFPKDIAEAVVAFGEFGIEIEGGAACGLGSL